MKWNRGNDVAVLVLAVVLYVSTPHQADEGFAGLFGGLVGSLIAAIVLVLLCKLVGLGIAKLRGSSL